MKNLGCCKFVLFFTPHNLKAHLKFSVFCGLSFKSVQRFERCELVLDAGIAQVSNKSHLDLTADSNSSPITFKCG